MIKSMHESLPTPGAATTFGATVSKNAMPQLLVGGYDNEQVWQQLELMNAGLLKQCGAKCKEFTQQGNLFQLTTDAETSSTKEPTQTKKSKVKDVSNKKKTKKSKSE